MGQHRRNIAVRRGWSVVAILVVSPLSAVADLSGRLSLGYDTNPAQRRHAEALVFGGYQWSALRHFDLESTDLEIRFDGEYRDYQGANDNFLLGLRGDWSRALGDGGDRVVLSFEADLYRDHLVPADEREEAAAGLRYDGLLSARSEFALGAEWRWLGYRNASLPWAGRPGGSNGGAGLRPGQRPVRRDDRLGTLSAEYRYFAGPASEAVFSAHYARLQSPVGQEAYRELGAGVGAAWQPSPGWGLELAADCYRRNYGQGRSRRQRDDDRFVLGASLKRILGDNELQLGFSQVRNESNVRSKTFDQWVAEFGIARTF